MRIIGLDVGHRRIGVAVSDPDERVATPVTVIEAPSVEQTTRVARLVDDYEAGLVVIGLPIGMQGEEGPQARAVREFGERLVGSVSTPIEYHDERLSSAEAERVMADSGLDARKRRGRVDMVAAAIILQTFLDGRNAGSPPLEDDCDV